MRDATQVDGKPGLKMSEPERSIELMFEDEEAIRVYVPPGWPGGVRPPGSDGWVRTATAFLLDCCPPEYRGHQVMTRHPVVLAHCARVHVDSQLEGARHAVAVLRPDLKGLVTSQVADDAVSALQKEEARLVRTARAVDLVGQALRDVRFVRRL